MVRFIVFALLASMSSILTPSYSSSTNDTTTGNNNNNYVEQACSATRYHDLCVRTLSPFSRTAKRDPRLWARAGVSVTLREAKRVARFLATFKRGEIDRGALSDCVECFEDTVDNLHESLYVLRKLSVADFSSQVDDVVTWVSASLTDEDTCVDGFVEGKVKGKRVKSIVSRVSNVTRLTSNALALVNKLATAGPKCLVNLS